ncbi:sporulation associated protein [Streptomyces sp. NPDC059788]|uniref:sporulation associated protein n=1 Tax=Streptomyces sp. NPDC059788 TaxID=3346948 RepID=UPI0036651224
MTRWQERNWHPNTDLDRLLKASGASRDALALRVNELTWQAGILTQYTHTSVTNWVKRGMIPRPPVPACIAAALEERLGRPVSVADINMSEPPGGNPDVGLDFPRESADAVRGVTTFWRHVDRRAFLNRSFAVGSFAVPVTRWLAVPADAATGHRGARCVGRGDLDQLWQAVEDARLADSRFGGGNWKSSSIATCLREYATPLLQGTYTEETGKALFRATAELTRQIGWSAFDAGHHGAAQRHFIQALRLARAAGDVQVGAYVLTTMSLAAFLRGHPSEAVDMAEGAYERAKNLPDGAKVLSFAKLAQARAHARAGEAHEATAALVLSENLLGHARPDTQPVWMNYYTHERLATDATEIYRDLGRSRDALAWSRQADAMPTDRYTRAVGIRLAVEASVHLQNDDLDQGLVVADRSMQLLSRVRSARAHGYVHDLTTSLAPRQRDKRVAAFVEHVRRSLPAAS